MLKLHGCASSNYYNVVKLALLEKGAEFEEVLVYTGAGPRYRPEYLQLSPLGKVPCLETDEGVLTESRCIVDYLERTLPGPSLYPSGAFAQAKMLELTEFIDLYLELPARRLIPYSFAKKAPHERLASEVLGELKKACDALPKLARFEGFLLGDTFTAADIAGVVHFPMIRGLVRGVLDRDPLGEVPGLLDYVARLSERPTVKKVSADRKADYPPFVAHIQSLYGVP